MTDIGPGSGAAHRAVFPGPPEFPMPGRPGPGAPDPGTQRPWRPGGPVPDPVPPARILIDPHAGWRDRLAERLLEQRIVLVSGVLDDEAATRLSAQLLTLDAEGDGAIRLELQNLSAELSAAVTLMGILDVLRAPVSAYASGELVGAALGVLASCARRVGYPNASFSLAEPRAEFHGTATAVTAGQQQLGRMADALYFRIAEATGRETEEIRADFGKRRTLTVAEALGYGLIQERAERAGPGYGGLSPGVPDYSN
jgi:ATP-dependent Clp protease protease subunit